PLSCILPVTTGYPQQKSLRDANFALSSNKREEHLVKLFENNPTNDQNHNPPRVKNIFQTLQRSLGHIAEEKRDKESSLFNRDVSDEQLTTINKGTLPEAISPDVPSRSMPCAQLLRFLQRDISVAAVSVAGILTATVLLLLALVTYIRKKQPLDESKLWRAYLNPRTSVIRDRRGIDTKRRQR
ncbi:uncharacterized protein C2orf92 homolog, partial [Pseudorca crassidens]|uniref:uncharacterized protein C2orf92 homolog n=1 Tax=Pseudorca crassidens TaxID=82174 RepID=UPI00352EEA30